MTDERSFVSGGRYRPSTREWRPLPGPKLPFGRRAQAVVWTGKEMLVWGGINGSSVLDGGFRYDPATDEWTPMSAEGAPSPRGYPSGVWIGDRLVIFGGRRDIYGRKAAPGGGIYDPAADRWTPFAPESAPSSCHGSAAVWTGSGLLVWGGALGRLGRGATLLGDGAGFDPGGKRWKTLPAAALLSGRAYPAAIWTGAELPIWGGLGDGPLGGGARFRPAGPR